ncbi:MAG: transglycosylase SLT domain-containing protein [Blastocatellia bacterium]|nr:transglycosylase SLT domain-containing protein [Blastocatellia bacterium]
MFIWYIKDLARRIGSGRLWFALAAAVLLGIISLSGLALLVARQFDRRTEERRFEPAQQSAYFNEDPQPTPGYVVAANVASFASPHRLYAEMTREQQTEFLEREARRVTLLIGNREYVFEREVIDYIKDYVDGYANRIATRSTRPWDEDLNYVFERARRDAPQIIASFRREGVPAVLGLYLPMIETEYNECLESPAGALGLFQFMPATAGEYGVSPADRCRVERMAPAAARYMKDRIREFGNDGMSVALSIAAYNRSPQSVRRDLQDVLDSRSNERTFWTLLAKKEKLDRYFRNENIKYVPKFFAAAIVGENPETFGLRIRKLSTYDNSPPSSDSARPCRVLSLDEIEEAARQVVGRISNDLHHYEFPSDKSHIASVKEVVEGNCNSPTLGAELLALERGRGQLIEWSENQIAPDLLAYAALAETNGRSPDALATAKRMAPRLIEVSKILKDSNADAALLSLAAYEMGSPVRGNHPILRRMEGRINHDTERNIWDLYRRGGLTEAEYGFVIRFLAFGIIAHEPWKFGYENQPQRHGGTERNGGSR